VRGVSRPSREPRSWGQRLVLLVSGGLVVGLLVTAGGLGYAYAKYSRLARVELGSVLTERASDVGPQNFLLVGVDSAANLDVDDPARAGREDISGLRSDTIMLLRVDPASEQASLLSLPRDLWVPLASGGNNRINAAIETGGPEDLIDTIEGYLGIPINHYVQVDFAGFRGLVDVIDGVQVWFDRPARDRRSGLSVEQAGCVTLEPDQALAYVRSRHYETFVDGHWRTDPTGDLGRISRQQDFIVRSLRRAVDRGVRNPVTLDNLVDAALDTVTVDDLLKGDDIVDLGRRFKGFDPERLDLFTLPVDDDSIGGAAVLRLRDTEAQPILDLFRGTDPNAVAPDSVRVKVLNGSGQPGQAGEASDALVAAGFTSAGTGEAESFDVERTVVRYAAGQGPAADLVARYLVAGAELQEVEGQIGADVVVVTGQDWAGLRSSPAPSTSSTTTAPGAQPSSTATTSTTTTTVIGQVPQPPPGAGC
jgi:polyisoprenyl-teichoic acid--peptidoglycan teichoic acid transferase